MGMAHCCWTDKELDVLHENHGLSNEAIAALLKNRTPDAVRHMRKRLYSKHKPAPEGRERELRA